MPRPFIPVANVASVEMIYVYITETYENTFHVRKATPYSFADLQAVRAIFDTWHNTTLKSQQGVNTVLTRIRTKALDTSSSATEDYFLPAPRAGTMGGSALPGNVAFAVKLVTGLAGRSYRGRIFMTGLTSSVITNGNDVQSSYATACVAAIATLIANLNAAGHTLVVVSYRADGAWRAAGVATPITNGATTDLHVDSMRRRLAGRGQ